MTITLDKTPMHNAPALPLPSIAAPLSPVDRLLGEIEARPSTLLADRFASLRMERNAALLSEVIIGESVTVGTDGIARVSYTGHGDATDRATITAAIHRTTNGPAR